MRPLVSHTTSWQIDFFLTEGSGRIADSILNGEWEQEFATQDEVRHYIQHTLGKVCWS